MPTVRQIEAFQAVMTSGGVTKAADMLGLGQPAVSRLIADLESAVGFPLFQRRARSLIPTAKARELAREVERSFLGMDHIRSTAHRLATSSIGALRLAIVPSLVSDVMHDLIGPFAKVNPEIALAVEVLTTLEAVERLESVNCDIGITNEPVQTNGLDAHKIATRVAVAVVPLKHPLTRLARPLQPTDFSGSCFISFMPNAAFRRQVDRMFDDAKVDRDLRYEVRTTAAACEMALALNAIAIVPVAPRLGSATSLRVLPIKPALSSDVILLKSRHRALPPTAEIFSTFARQRLSQMKAMPAEQSTATVTRSLSRNARAGSPSDRRSISRGGVQ